MHKSEGHRCRRDERQRGACGGARKPQFENDCQNCGCRRYPSHEENPRRVEIESHDGLARLPSKEKEKAPVRKSHNEKRAIRHIPKHRGDGGTPLGIPHFSSPIYGRGAWRSLSGRNCPLSSSIAQTKCHRPLGHAFKNSAQYARSPLFLELKSKRTRRKMAPDDAGAIQGRGYAISCPVSILPTTRPCVTAMPMELPATGVP